MRYDGDIMADFLCVIMADKSRASGSGKKSKASDDSGSGRKGQAI